MKTQTVCNENPACTADSNNPSAPTRLSNETEAATLHNSAFDSSQMAPIDSNTTFSLSSSSLPDFRKEFETHGSVATEVSLEPSTSLPEKLMSMYLAGRLSQGDLVYKLKSYNMVTADNIIRESKHSATRAVDFNDVPKASVDPITHEADKPLPGTQGTKGEKDAGKGLEQARDEHTKEQEKKQEQEKQQLQREDRVDQVMQTEIVEEQNKQVIEAHQERERLRHEELEKDGEFSVSNSLVEEDGIGSRSKKGALDCAAKRAKGADRVLEEKKQQELLLQATTIALSGRSEKDKKEEEELLEEMLEKWDLFKS
jgi:hypothetical protein